MNNVEMDNSKSVKEWLDSRKSERTAREYKDRWEIWLEYCKVKGLLLNGSDQLEDMKKRRLSNDNTVKFFYDNEVPKFFKWLQKTKGFSESSSLSMTTAIRSFFSYHRYSLEIQKEALPSSEKVEQKYEDHAFDIYQLRSMFNVGDLRERTVLTCAKDLWLRVGDFLSLEWEKVELAIKREEETAQNETREPDIIEFELTTSKEKEPCMCHLSKETVELLKDYMKAYPKTEKLFPLNEESLSELLRRLAKKSQITQNGRIRFHCLRKFGITLMHGKVTEPVMKYMVGKHISKDLRTYIQNNRETYKAFKVIEPLISLTKTNGNGNTMIAKQLEELKRATFRQLAIMKVIEKSLSKEEKQKIIEDITKDFGLDVAKFSGKALTLEEIIELLAETLEKQDLERILAENGNHS